MPRGETNVSKNFFNPYPKYLQIRAVLLRQFGSDYAPGDRLPTELALTQEFGVSRETVREALRPLENDGTIRRHQGRGTFLAQLPQLDGTRLLTGLVEDFTNLGFETETQVLETGPVLPPSDMLSVLRVPTGSTVFRIRRLRFLEGAPLSQHMALLPLEIGAKVVELDLRKTTLFHEIGKTLGYDITETYQTIDATIADAASASYLQISIGAPVLVIGRVFAIEGGNANMYFQSSFRSDRYHYTVQLTQPQQRRHAPSAADLNTIARKEGHHVSAVDA